MKKVASYTLGCKVNQYDTEAVIEIFKENQYEVVAFNEIADVYIVNTCTVTHLSDRKCRQMLRKTKKLNPDSILIAMGCYAQSTGDALIQEVPEVDIVIGTNKRLQILDYIAAYEQGRALAEIDNIMEVTDFEELQISSMGDHTRAYLKIQEGCDNYCTYCIIPYVRGKIRSRKPENVIKEAERLVAAGFKEIVLAGIHVASYGKDLTNTSLLAVIEELHSIEGLERIRLSSIEPVVVTDAFLATISRLPKLCRHFHLSLQSGSDTVLKRMNRRYTREEYKQSAMRLREVWPDVALTTDIIVGFPKESEEEFNETVAFVKDVHFSQVHIFPFSPRTGTPAAKMTGQVTPEIKDERVKMLAEEEKKMRLAFLDQMLGKEMDVLFEIQEKGTVVGYTDNYLKVKAASEIDYTNQIKTVRILSRQEDALIGEIL